DEFGNTSGIIRGSPRNVSPDARAARETPGAEDFLGPAREGPTTWRPGICVMTDPTTGQDKRSAPLPSRRPRLAGPAHGLPTGADPGPRVKSAGRGLAAATWQSGPGP